MKILHSSKIDSKNTYFQENKLSKKHLENYLDLKFLNNIDQLLKQNFF